MATWLEEYTQLKTVAEQKNRIGPADNIGDAGVSGSLIPDRGVGSLQNV